MVTLSGFWLPGAGGGFDSDRSFLAARLNQLQKRGVPRAGSTGFVGVEVGWAGLFALRAGRVETIARSSGDLWSVGGDLRAVG